MVMLLLLTRSFAAAVMILLLGFVLMAGTSAKSPTRIVHSSERSMTGGFLPWNKRGGSAEGSHPDIGIDGTDKDHMPSMFAPTESHYDRYAACLAATEGLRRVRDKALVTTSRQRSKKDDLEEDRSRIHAEYVMNSGKVLKAMGMSISQFNQLGREVSQDPPLKEKVRESIPIKKTKAQTGGRHRHPL